MESRLCNSGNTTTIAVTKKIFHVLHDFDVNQLNNPSYEQERKKYKH
jgi:hypothetical protein